jgi:hypothetical protein
MAYMKRSVIVAVFGGRVNRRESDVQIFLRVVSIRRSAVRLLSEAQIAATKEMAMEYLLLIYNSEADGKKMSAAEQTEIYQNYMTFTEDITKSGKNKGGNALQGIATATTVRVRNGKTTVTDGPFAETKEQLGGYYLVEAKDLDEAISIAARIPGARNGSIEVRPIMKFN